MGNKLTYPEVDLTGKVALVTGGNTGIGYQTAKGLARLGAHTFIGCRNKERAENAIAQMKKELLMTQQKNDDNSANKPATKDAKSEEPASSEDKPTEDAEALTTTSGEKVRSKEERGGQQSEAAAGKKDIKIEYLPLDLGSFQSTKECVRLFKERDLPLHILVNNAAILGNLYTKTDDDLEIQFQVNHLGPTLLTLELLPILVQTAEICGDVRIVFVTSSGHYYAEPFDPETLNKTEENYKRAKQYMNTKLYNVMTGYCLQRRLQKDNITVSSVHPGYVRTELPRSIGDMKLLTAALAVTKPIMARTPTEGAATSLNCAVNPELNSQQHFYYDTCKAKVSSEASRNEEFQEQMWKKTFEFLNGQLSPETIGKYGPKEEVPTQTAEATVAIEVQDKTEEPPRESDPGKKEEQNKEGVETTKQSDGAGTE